MSELHPAPAEYEPIYANPSRWGRAAMCLGLVAAFAAGCAGPAEQIESHAGQVAYDAEAFVEAATCAAKQEQPIDGAGMAWVTAAMQNGVIGYKDGTTVDCGPGGGLPYDAAWNATDAAFWIDNWSTYVEKAYPDTTFIELSNEEIKDGALEETKAVPGRTFVLLNLDGASERSQPWKFWTRVVEYEQIFPVVGNDESGRALVSGVSLYEDGTAPTDIPPWLISDSAHGGPLIGNNPNITATVVHFSDVTPSR